jgi:ankyrin repeat protein
VQVVKELLTNDTVDVNLRSTTDGTTALWMASQGDHVQVVKELLTNDTVDVNLQRTIDDVTALWIASSKWPCASRQGVAHEQQGRCKSPAY